jgi:predicted amidohydrolase
MNREKAILIAPVLLSSVLYFLALHFDPFFFLVFLFLIPIFMLFLLEFKLSFLHGFLWGLLFYFLHFFSIFKIIYEVSNFWLVFVLSLLFYFSFWSGLWFYLSDIFFTKFYRYVALLFFTNLYFFFVNYWILSFVEFGCGYSVNYPLNVFDLSFGYFKEIYFFLITIFSLSVSLFLIKKNVKYILFAAFSLVPFFLLKKNVLVAISGSQCLFLKNTCSDLLDRVLEVGHCIEKKEDKEIKNIFFPESTFLHSLNEFEYVFNWWPQDVNIFLCANWRIDNAVNNSVIHVFNGKVIQKYGKRRLMPLFEYTPWFFKFIPGVEKIVGNNLEIVPGQESNYFFINQQKFKVAICSDFFFESIFEKFDKEHIILFMNNSLFSNNFQKLLYKTARLRNVFIVGYKQAV